MALTQKSAHRKDINAGISPMEHRHFATVATIIREAPNFSEDNRSLAEYFADRLADTNPNFDRDRFLRACQPQ